MKKFIAVCVIALLSITLIGIGMKNTYQAKKETIIHEALYGTRTYRGYDGTKQYLYRIRPAVYTTVTNEAFINPDGSIDMICPKELFMTKDRLAKLDAEYFNLFKD